jgi:hypothetical protein
MEAAQCIIERDWVTQLGGANVKELHSGVVAASNVASKHALFILEVDPEGWL